MPLPNFHAARVISAARFEEGSFRMINIGPKPSGITAIAGRLSGDVTTKVQSYRFEKNKFTPSEAKKWLTSKNIKTIEFEAASNNPKK